MTPKRKWRDWMFTSWRDSMIAYTFGSLWSCGGKHRDFVTRYEQVIPGVGIYREVYRGKDVAALRRLKDMRRTKGVA